ncbi:hypothetical protein JTE90_013194 [Oedothorax gibbosus]|uniref:Uncharacterized protein n=1 Tax=Oedothorax gibbosus TaxID=931172 RepID=A0AAV6TZ44_9ARAC|nr:hypothetical protein JTE90_013194 [Oedothorax gibbosus]
MGMGVACDGTTLWIAGGISRDGEHLNLCDSVWCFNKDNTRWIRKSTLPDPVAFPALLQNNGRLVLVGGATQSTGEDKNQLESVDTVLTLQGQMWTKKEPMSVQCHSAVAATFGNKIFIFGGLQTQSVSQLSEAIFYDGDSDEWAHLCDLPHDAAGFIVALAEQRS